ncbi:MAG: glycosyltransferase family 4 protein [Planctomycetes bacterium]|nr:glycosyltransferase family 4 protein [Planctomycetota bacterium]
MKILYCLDKYLDSAGGADRAARGLAAALTEAGHEVRVVQAGKQAGEELFEDVRVRTVPLPASKLFRDSDWRMVRWNGLWYPVICDEINAFRPGLLITQNMLAPASVSAARSAGVKSAVFFHAYRGITPTLFRNADALAAEPISFMNAPLRSKLKWPIVKCSLNLYEKAYRASDLVIANSDYTAKVIKRFFAREAKVLYPITDITLPPPHTPQVNGPILFVKPQSIKGAQVLLATVAKLPEKQFVVVGKASERMRKKLIRMPNIEYHGWCSNMDEMYQQASLLLVPSQWPEPFGRVIVEAACYGVPCVASDAGAIPEAAGKGGILVQPPDAPGVTWAYAITMALSTEHYTTLSLAARAHAEALLKEHNAKRLLQVLGL